MVMLLLSDVMYTRLEMKSIIILSCSFRFSIDYLSK
jgi:hypothetical protein